MKGNSNKIRIVLANAPINNGNRGCVALTYSALYLIDYIFSTKGVEYEVYLPDSQFYDSKPHFIYFGNKTIKFKDCQYLSGVDFANSLTTKFDFIRRSLKSKKIEENTIKRADFILDIGQGDSFSDIYGEKRFRIIDRIHRIALRYKKPYCILPQTIGPFSEQIVRNRALKSILGAKLVMPRDNQSLQWLLSNTNNDCYQEYIDVAFFLPFEKMEFSHNYYNVGINVSALLWHGGYDGNNQFGLKADYKSLIKELIDSFLSKENIIVHLIPHVVEQERGVENDYAVCYDLWRLYKNHRLVIAPFALDPISIKNYISGMDFFMGARMHSTIAAFSSGVPVIPMSYSRKFNGLFCETLNYNYIVDLKQQSNNDIVGTIISYFKDREVLKNEIDNCLRTIIDEKKHLIVEDLNRFFFAK